MIDFGHDVSAERTNALADKQDQRRKDRAERPIRCPGCKRTDIDIVVGQYTWNTQDYTPSQDDWSVSDYYYEGDKQIAARCRHCDTDLTMYLLRKGWDFEHDVFVKNRAHERPTKRSNPALWAELRCSDDELKVKVEAAQERFGRLLDEQERRRGHSTAFA
jgi:hypothetical protein